MSSGNALWHQHWLAEAHRYASLKATAITAFRKRNSNRDRSSQDFLIDKDQEIAALEVMRQRAEQSAIMYGIAVLVERT